MGGIVLIDVEQARRDTPGCAHVLHFNNAGAALMPSAVLEAQVAHLQLEAQIGGYEAFDRAEPEVEHTYAAIARLIGCDAEDVAIVENATRAWDMAFYAIPFAAGDRILTSEADYASNFIAYLQVARRTGAVVEVVPSDAVGQMSVQALADRLDDRVRLVSVTHVPTNSGLINPIEDIGRRVRQARALYLVDACQSAGQIPLDVERIGCDFLSATSRKYLRGPRGAGFLYVRRDTTAALEPPLLDLHAARWIERGRYEVRRDARRFENWEGNMAARIGLGVAVDYALDLGIEAIAQRVWELAQMLRTGLAAIPGVSVTDIGRARCGIVTFACAGKSPEAIRKALLAQRINVTTSTVFSTRVDMERRRLSDVVRASVHYYNTECEVERFCAAMEAIAKTD